jgi:hypothetical protein
MATSEPDGRDDVAPVLSPSNSSATSSCPRSLRKAVPTTKEEALHLASGSVVSLTKARSQLIAKGYLAQNGKISFLSLSLILFQIAVDAKTPVVVDSIKAAAFLLESLGVDTLSDHIVSSINAKLLNTTEALDMSINNLENMEEELGMTMAALANAVLQLKETSEDSLQLLNDAADRLRNHMDKQNITQAQVQAVPNQANSQTLPSSYANVARSHIPLAHTNAIGRHSE